MHGFGTLFRPDGTVFFKGDFKRNLPTGSGFLRLSKFYKAEAVFDMGILTELYTFSDQGNEI